MAAPEPPGPPGPPTVASQPAAWAPGPPSDDAGGGGWVVAPLIAALPAFLLIFLWIVAPGFLAPLADDRVSIVGAPFIVPVVLLLAGMILAVAWIARRMRSPVVGIVLAAIWAPIGLFI